MISSIISRNSSRLVFFLRKLYSMSVNVSCFILLAPPLFCWYYYTILRTWTGVGIIQRFLRNRELERENVELREANIILNDAISCFVKVKKVKTWKWHLWLFMNKGKYTVKGICLVFKTNELGYYQWLINWSESSAREPLSVKMQEITGRASYPDNENYVQIAWYIIYTKRYSCMLSDSVQCHGGYCYLTQENKTQHGTTKITTEIQYHYGKLYGSAMLNCATTGRSFP